MIFCWHKWKYIGKQRAYKWVGGVNAGVTVEISVDAQECKKCGKQRIIE